ncbi:hypothetical protein SARC_05616 [Sphaeroforma arctica JP610]|uniref:Uncharacterized protein n=1 Tax=Sphaeroforma arctica JP610 TaxID=667725 RepID=A0A0L0FZ38_9EUKA|nr:hypothetical protein SARC_05616 [Sphaeroforma arctica JP610]KNC82087.1 hypothetical protein SARC_05616 [Sphaeroforma arctica JP610]|eukprot:XP_014155989.1 hypothetical protein SARC_05616 [Sphaeroforma arctica JP610]
MIHVETTTKVTTGNCLNYYLRVCRHKRTSWRAHKQNYYKGVGIHLQNYGSRLAVISTQDKTLPYIAGYAVYKLFNNFPVGCDDCQNVASMGKGLEEDEQILAEYSCALRAQPDRKGLTWPLRSVVVMTGLLLDIVECIINSKVLLKQFNESTSASRVGLGVIRVLISHRVDTCGALQSLKQLCTTCSKDRSLTIVPHLLNTLYNIVCNNMSLVLNIKSAATIVTLSMVKTNKKERTTNIVDQH